LEIKKLNFIITIKMSDKLDIDSEVFEDIEICETVFTNITNSSNFMDVHYSKNQGQFWSEHEIDHAIKTDKINWVISLPAEVKQPIQEMIRYLRLGDGTIIETFSKRLISRIKDHSILQFARFQLVIEDVHNRVYDMLSNVYLSTDENLMNNSVASDAVHRKIDWIKKWTGDSEDIQLLSYDTIQSLRELAKYAPPSIRDIHQKTIKKLEAKIPRLALLIFINVISEGMFFQGGFNFIIWVDHYYPGTLPALTKGNENIARDEGNHTITWTDIYNTLRHKLSDKRAHEIMREAVEKVEKPFIMSALPNDLKGMNSNTMLEYIKYLADCLLKGMKYPVLYGAKMNCPWMDKQSIGMRISDFFIDPNVTEYNKTKKIGVSGESYSNDINIEVSNKQGQKNNSSSLLNGDLHDF
jgi:ribonucleotide reductase beta subunit family protein with ferritin-like domain